MKYQVVWPEAIVVYPQGLPTVTPRDPEGKRAGWQHLPGDNKDRDLKFVDTCSPRFAKSIRSTTTAFMPPASRMAAPSRTCSGINGPKSLPLLRPAVARCGKQLKLTEPKPAFIVAGKEDKLVPIKDQEAAIERIRKLDSATADGKPGDGGSMVYKSEKGTPVQTLIHPGGHVLPPEAPRLIVEFFKAQELEKVTSAARPSLHSGTALARTI